MKYILSLITVLCSLLSYARPTHFSSDISTDSTAKTTVTYNSSTTPDFKIHYMGNVEAGHIFPWQNFLNTSSGAVSLTTTHGVQLKPYFFVGAGIGAWLAYSKNGLGLTSQYFFNARASLPKHRFQPFADLKIGRIGSLNTFVSPSIGYKFTWGQRGGVYLSLGSSCIINHTGSQWDGLNARIGFDF